MTGRRIAVRWQSLLIAAAITCSFIFALTATARAQKLTVTVSNHTDSSLMLMRLHGLELALPQTIPAHESIMLTLYVNSQTNGFLQYQTMNANPFGLLTVKIKGHKHIDELLPPIVKAKSREAQGPYKGLTLLHNDSHSAMQTVHVTQDGMLYPTVLKDKIVGEVPTAIRERRDSAQLELPPNHGFKHFVPSLRRRRALSVDAQAGQRLTRELASLQLTENPTLSAASSPCASPHAPLSTTHSPSPSPPVTTRSRADSLSSPHSAVSKTPSKSSPGRSPRVPGSRLDNWFSRLSDRVTHERLTGVHNSAGETQTPPMSILTPANPSAATTSPSSNSITWFAALRLNDNQGQRNQ